MNDLGTLATDIVVYHFDHNDADHPITFVSGWLNANIGQLNGYTYEEFTVTGAGSFSPSLEPVEKSIFTCLYEIDYYDRLQRKTLRGILDTSADWTTLKEGDSVIQKTSKHQIAKSYADSRKEAKQRLDDIVSKYNIYKASPVQVAGSDSIPEYLDWTL